MYVKWKGYDSTFSTWEPVKHILDPVLITDFLATFAFEHPIKLALPQLRTASFHWLRCRAQPSSRSPSPSPLHRSRPLQWPCSPTHGARPHASTTPLAGSRGRQVAGTDTAEGKTSLQWSGGAAPWLTWPGTPLTGSVATPWHWWRPQRCWVAAGW